MKEPVILAVSRESTIQKRSTIHIFISPLVQKLVLVTTLPIFIGLALLATLMLFQYEQAIRDTVEQRYILFAGEIKTRSEQWLKSGLLPEDIPNMSRILDSIDQQIEEEFIIDVIDDKGVIIYSLDPSRLQNIVQDSIIRNFNFFIEENYGGAIPKEQYLIYNQNNQRVIMAPLFDNFGNWAAAAMIAFPQSSYTDVIGNATYKMIYYFIIIAIAIAVTALILGGMVMRRPVQWLWHLNERFTYLSDDKDSSNDGQLSDFEKTVTESLRQMDKNSSTIHDIDTEQSAEQDNGTPSASEQQ